MLLAVFDKINFTTFFARKHGIRKLTKMAWILINYVSKKKKTLKKHRSKNVTSIKIEINQINAK